MENLNTGYFPQWSLKEWIKAVTAIGGFCLLVFLVIHATNSQAIPPATAEGGNDPYQWEFYIYKDGEICYSNSESTINFFEWTPETTGDYNLVVNVIDATGFKVTHSTEFSVT